MNDASNGNGTSVHLRPGLLKSSTDASITHIPYQGDAVPAVPTLIEAGVRGFDVSAGYGGAASAGTSPAVIARIEQALERVARDPEVGPAMASRGADVGFLGSAAMGAFLAADAAKWKRVASFARITLG